MTIPTTDSNNNPVHRFSHTFDVTTDDNSDSQITIELDGYCATDYYATNLELTGQANWFGSLNMCHLMAAEHSAMFNGVKSVLELGSGIGRAGIMAAKLLLSSQEEDNTTNLLLTDGEQALMPILEHNCQLNGLAAAAVDCQFLRWGKNDILQQHVDNGTTFDVILGADLIYGDRDDVPQNVRNLFMTVSSLLTTVDVVKEDDEKSDLRNSATGKFYLAFTKRNTMSPEYLLEIAIDEFGLKGTMHDDFCFDIWDNNVDPESVFWRDCIFVFERVVKRGQDTAEGVGEEGIENVTSCDDKVESGVKECE